MSGILKQPVVIDNRPGAGGVTGMKMVAKADPDGYTFGIGSAAASPSASAFSPTRPMIRQGI